MNLALLIKHPIFKNWFINQLAYYAKGWFTFHNDKLTPGHASQARVVVVAKSHFSERWQSYSSISKKELKQIIDLQKKSEDTGATIFQAIENKSIDGFDVKKITFDKSLLMEIGTKKILIPETELFSHKIESLVLLKTPVGELFFSSFGDKVSSSYAKGLVKNIDTFKLTAGIPQEINEIIIEKDQFGRFIFEQLISLNMATLFSKTAFNIQTWFNRNNLHLLYWAPLLTALCFFIISNSFLWIKANNIENRLAEQSSQVGDLLIYKQTQDKRSHLLKLLNEEFSKTGTVHEHWSLIYNLVENGMIISRLSFKDDLISVRGKAQKASNVLANIAKHPNVISASFNGAMRKQRNMENFTLDIVPVKKTPIKIVLSPVIALVDESRVVEKIL